MKNTKTLSLSIFCIGTTIIGSTAFAETMESVPVTVEIAKQQMTASTIEEVGKLKATDSAALSDSSGPPTRQGGTGRSHRHSRTGLREPFHRQTAASTRTAQHIPAGLAKAPGTGADTPDAGSSKTGCPRRASNRTTDKGFS